MKKSQAWEEGFLKGQEKGYEEGFADGNERGLKDGHTKGYLDALKIFVDNIGKNK